MSKKIIQNGVQVISTGEIFLSTNRWDYKKVDLGHTAGETVNGVGTLKPISLSIDGGLSYIKRGHSPDIALGEPFKEICLGSETPVWRILEELCWGTNGKNGDQPTTHKFIKDLDVEHLDNLVNVYNKKHKIASIHLYTMMYWLDQKKTDGLYAYVHKDAIERKLAEFEADDEDEPKNKEYIDPIDLRGY